MIQLALIGKSISHSRSQEVYESLLGQKISYTLLDFPSEDLIPLAQDLLNSYQGISITSPYKRHFLTKVRVTEEAKAVGAINCLFKVRDEIWGANTDYLAIKSLFPKNIKDKIVILGDGVMSNVFQYYFKEQNYSYEMISRRSHVDISCLDLNSYKLVINCCSRQYNFMGHVSPEVLFWDMNYGIQHQGTIPLYRDGSEFLFEQGRQALLLWKIMSVA